MANRNISKWLGPAALIVGAFLLILGLFSTTRRSENIPVSAGPINERIEVSMFQVNGLVDSAIRENPALKAEQESVRKEMKQSLAEQEVLVREALAQDLAQRDTIVRNRLTELMVMSIYKQADARLNGEAVKQYYQENKDRYARPLKRQVVQILVPVTNKTDTEQARARLEEIYTRVNQDESIIPEPRWFTIEELKMDYGPTLAGLIFEMPVEQWSEPVQSSSGWHRIKVLEERPGEQRPFKEVEKQVTEDLRRELRSKVYKEEIQRMKQKYDIAVTE